MAAERHNEVLEILSWRMLERSKAPFIFRFLDPNKLSNTTLWIRGTIFFQRKLQQRDELDSTSLKNKVLSQEGIEITGADYQPFPAAGSPPVPKALKSGTYSFPIFQPGDSRDWKAGCCAPQCHHGPKGDVLGFRSLQDSGKHCKRRQRCQLRLVPGGTPSPAGLDVSHSPMNKSRA